RIETEGEFGLDALLQGGEPDLLEALDRSPCEGLVGEIRERRPAPEAERVAEEIGGLLCLAFYERSGGLARSVLEAVQIELAGGNAKDVSRCTRLDHRRRAQELPELGDLALYLRDGCHRGVTRVEVVGEALDRD